VANVTNTTDPTETPGRAQARAVVIMLTLISRHAGLPALAWSVSESGHVVGRRTAGPDVAVAADMGAWAGALDAAVSTSSRCDGRTIYRAVVDLTGTGRVAPGSVPVTITGIGVAASVDQAVLVDAEGLSARQLDGTACVRCGAEFARVSVPVGRVAGVGQVFACDPGCPDAMPAQPADPCDPVADDDPYVVNELDLPDDERDPNRRWDDDYDIGRIRGHSDDDYDLDDEIITLTFGAEEA